MMTEETRVKKKGNNPVNNTQERQEKRARFVLYSSLFFAGLLSFYTIFGDQGVIDLYQFQLKINVVESEIQELDQTNIQLGEEIRLLRDNPYYIERIAREELGLIKPGEVIYYIKDSRVKDKKD